MGLDVAAISKAKLVTCRGDEACDETHYGVGSYRKRRDGLKSGCYIVGKGGRSFGFRAGSYTGYSEWRRHLSLLALGVEPEEIWEHPRRFRAKRFAELIDFPDGVGPIIGPKTSAKLHADFVAFASKARKFYLNPEARIPVPDSKRPGTKEQVHINQAGLSATKNLNEFLGVVNESESDDKTWMWQVYRDFRRAFKIASDGGFVVFC